MNEYTVNSLPKSQGNKRKDLRITVIKTSSLKDNYGVEPDDLAPGCEKSCPCFHVGDTYSATDKGGNPPHEFPCEWAWHDMYQDIQTLRLGGNFEQYAEGKAYVCCTDGLHPVFFKLERID